MDKSFINKIQAVIESNSELSNSKVLRAVLESVDCNCKDKEFLTDLKDKLSELNTTMKNDTLSSIIGSIDNQLGECDANNLDQYCDDQANEFDLKGVCDDVCDGCPNDAELKTKVMNINDECEASGNPSYMYIVPLMNTLEGSTCYDCVKEALEYIHDYLNENQEKLAMIDAINYCKKMGAYAVNPKSVNTLLECLYNKEYNPDIISMKLGESSNNGTMISLLESLRSIRASKSNVFDLSQSKGDTKVYEYVGPVLRENKSITFYVDNTFIKVCNEKLSKPKQVINEGKTNIYELNEMDVYSKNAKFYNVTKAFESLGFQLVQNGVSAKLQRSNVDFKLNENNTIDFYINGNKVENISVAKGSNSLVTESQSTKSCVYSILENTNMIYNIPFVKFLVNESRNKVCMVMNIDKDYFVYDFVNENKTDVYKLDGYKLYSFCVENLGFDISSTFGVEIADKTNKLAKIEESKAEIIKTIESYKESIKKLDEAKKGGLQEVDLKDVDSLTKTLFGQMKNLETNYEELCKASDKIRFSGKEKVNESEDMNAEAEAGEEPAAQAEAPETTDEASTESIETPSNEGESGAAVDESLRQRVINRAFKLLESYKYNRINEAAGQPEEVKPATPSASYPSSTIVPDKPDPVNGNAAGNGVGEKNDNGKKINQNVAGNRHAIDSVDNDTAFAEDKKDINNKNNGEGTSGVTGNVAFSDYMKLIGNEKGMINNLRAIFKLKEAKKVLNEYALKYPHNRLNQLKAQLEASMAKETKSGTEAQAEEKVNVYKQQAEYLNKWVDAEVDNICKRRPLVASKIRAVVFKVKAGVCDGVVRQINQYMQNDKYKKYAPALNEMLSEVKNDKAEADKYTQAVANGDNSIDSLSQMNATYKDTAGNKIEIIDVVRGENNKISSIKYLLTSKDGKPEPKVFDFKPEKGNLQEQFARKFPGLHKVMGVGVYASGENKYIIMNLNTDGTYFVVPVLPQNSEQVDEATGKIISDDNTLKQRQYYPNATEDQIKNFKQSTLNIGDRIVRMDDVKVIRKDDEYVKPDPENKQGLSPNLVSYWDMKVRSASTDAIVLSANYLQANNPSTTEQGNINAIGDPFSLTLKFDKSGLNGSAIDGVTPVNAISAISGWYIKAISGGRGSTSADKQTEPSSIQEGILTKAPADSFDSSASGISGTKAPAPAAGSTGSTTPAPAAGGTGSTTPAPAAGGATA